MNRCVALTPAELKRHPLPPVVEADKESKALEFNATIVK